MEFIGSSVSSGVRSQRQAGRQADLGIDRRHDIRASSYTSLLCSVFSAVLTSSWRLLYWFDDKMKKRNITSIMN